ncbi:CAP domain-containing protein [Streptomyces sp. ODS05-4]|uniref:CAP domain-containing protein n=1 Tax=Streptomyces sp. ODS05-4 TaxID=2944939 RepID=UPI00210A0B28|nr:CAP domain-containing protein [Streptomyces sp. ODS05-4]
MRDQGVATLVAGAVALVAVAVGAFLADGAGGGGGQEAARTPAAPAGRTGAGSTAAPAPPAAPRAAGTADAYAQRVAALVNTERRKAGCAALRTDTRLRAAARAHAKDMADRDYYAHDSPEGEDAGDRLDAAGYRWRTWGENIHRGPRDPARAVRDWMASPGHRKNLLDCAFKDIGVGVDLRAGGPWWVQDFGVPE